MKNLIKILILASIFGTKSCLSVSFSELAKQHGFKVIDYDVKTEDGYILKIFRIPGHGKPVLLQHGLQSSADTFILRGNTSLAAALAAHRYDVWFGNIRGNKYSRRHVKLNPDKDHKFWDFSIQEHGYFDIAAMVDFILNKSGRKKLDYIGHSQGGTVMFILGSTRPQYNEKIGVFIALAPAVFLHDVAFFVKSLFYLAPIINYIFSLKKEEIFGESSLETILMKKKCSISYIGYACLNIGLFPLIGFNRDEFEPSFYSILLSHLPSGSSIKNLHHLSQIGLSGRFQKYDYKDRNRAMYGNNQPPVYDLKKVTMPVVLVASKHDKIISLADTARLRKILPNVVEYGIVQAPLFNHLDFVVGRNSYKEFYPKVLKTLQKYSTM